MLTPMLLNEVQKLHRQLAAHFSLAFIGSPIH